MVCALISPSCDKEHALLLLKTLALHKTVLADCQPDETAKHSICVLPLPLVRHLPSLLPLEITCILWQLNGVSYWVSILAGVPGDTVSAKKEQPEKQYESEVLRRKSGSLGSRLVPKYLRREGRPPKLSQWAIHSSSTLPQGTWTKLIEECGPPKLILLAKSQLFLVRMELCPSRLLVPMRRL